MVAFPAGQVQTQPVLPTNVQGPMRKWAVGGGGGCNGLLMMGDGDDGDAAGAGWGVGAGSSGRVLIARGCTSERSVLNSMRRVEGRSVKRAKLAARSKAT